MNEKTTSAPPISLTMPRITDLFEQSLADAITSAPLTVRRYVGGLLATRGKALRAHALLACAMGEGDKIPPEAAYLAAAVELLHLASLVHDDVIDDAELRRGSPSLQALYGKRRAVICGDFLLCAALQTAGKTRRDDLPEELLSAAARLCSGELLQEENCSNLALSTRTYLKIIRGKTATLFESCFWAGAALAGNNRRVSAKFRRMGRYVGMGFQLCDDCADYEQEAALSGKPSKRDNEQGVITLPLIFTLKNGLAGGSVAAVRESGGLNYTYALAQRYFQKAAALLQSDEMTPEKRAAVLAVIKRCGGRVQT